MNADHVTAAIEADREHGRPTWNIASLLTRVARAIAIRIRGRLT